MEKRKTILLVDGNAMIFRSYFGTNPENIETVVEAFNKTLTKHMRITKADDMFVAFDYGGKTFRHQVYPDYKAGRPEKPELLLQSIVAVKKAMLDQDIQHQYIKNIEGDDILGSLAKRLEADHDVVILTVDRDLTQCVTEHVKVLVPSRGKAPLKWYTLDNMEIAPSLVVDLKAFEGDTSDNIPGIKGIGKVAAARLIKVGDIDAIYSNLLENCPTARIYTLLNGQYDTVKFWKHLVTIRTDIDVTYTPQYQKVVAQATPGEILNDFVIDLGF